MRGIAVEPLLKKLQVVSVTGHLPDKMLGITQDSRLVESGYIFAARSGSRSAGSDFIPMAAERGAVLVATDEAFEEPQSLPVIRVHDFHQALVFLSKVIYHDPTSILKLIGVTGTNGKTTSVHLIRSIISEAGQKCGLLSTVGYDTVKRRMGASLTTPDIDRLSALLCEMADEGCSWAVIEVSSHALVQGRIDGLKIAAAAYTNISQEHLDYHRTVENYADAKAQLFRALSPEGLAVINIDDEWGRVMVKAAKGKVITYSAGAIDADLKVNVLEHSLTGGRFRLEWAGRNFQVKTPLIGIYNGENIALAAGVALGLGFDIEAVKAGVENVKSIPGRMEAVNMGQPFSVFVDYSHTPDALENALRSLRELCEKSLTVVFGCGGDRDRSKRPIMGRVAGELANRIIVTDDNPRDEQPGVIAGEILKGIRTRRRDHVTVELDRREAIRKALLSANEGDVILITGKGHETYQLTGGVKREFDDRQVAKEELASMLNVKC